MNDVQVLASWDLEATHRTFADGTFHGVVMGVEIQKSADDLERYRELVDRTRPDIVIETGTRAGGSALWFHKELGLEVISIDVAPQFVKKGGPPYVGPGIEWIKGSSISDWVFEIVLKRIAGKRVMVSLDSDHHSHHVQAEIHRFGALVTPGCFMVVEDGCFDLFDRAGHPDWARVGGSQIPQVGGPLHAIETSGIGQSARWRRAFEIEGITPVSHSPVGWWERNHD